MKTQAKIKVILIILMIISISAQSQNTYLKISEDNKTSVSYPPETKFTLTNTNGYIILKESGTPLVFKIDEAYTLEVFPSYKKETDTYKLTNGKIELVSKLEYFNTSKQKTESHQSNGLSLVKATYSRSEENNEESNVVMTFSNGVVFTYKDGKYNAMLNGAYLNIENHYLIHTDEGVIKLSYRPKSKEIWWVYELIDKD